MELEIPSMALVMMVGASGSGKSTFVAKHFSPWEVLSSDHLRGVVSNDPNSLAASEDAFAALEYLAGVRLRRGLLTVIDATNVTKPARSRWVQLAKKHDMLPVAIVLDVDPKTAAERNQTRDDRAFGDAVVFKHARALRRDLRGIKREGIRYIKRLDGVEAVDAVTRVVRAKAWTDRREETGPFDLIGDIHGCHDELLGLLDQLGWTLQSTGQGEELRHTASHAEGRQLLFLGDLCDRGPASDKVFHLVMDLVEQGTAICVPGNHENKLGRWLDGKKVKLTHGLDKTVEQLSARSEAFRERVKQFIGSLVSHYVLDEGKLVVAHAGMTEAYAGRASGRVRSFALYGQTTGEIDSFGLPIRQDWARDYRGSAAVIYGHTPVPYTEWVHNTLCIDTGCVFGGELTALRWPEREQVSVGAKEVYCEPVKPLAQPKTHSEIPDLQDLLEAGRIETRFKMSVGIQPERAAVALEILSRFAENPRWLVHLPPTMAPVGTSDRPGFLEHPDQAFTYYRKQGVQTVVCEEKHMGSRAVLLVARTPEALAARFGLPGGSGRVLSRRGRRFFKDAALEAELIGRLVWAMTAADFWERHSTDWAVLDAELMPWSAKARALLEQQYAPVGTAAAQSLGAVRHALRQAAQRQEIGSELSAVEQRLASIEAYRRAYRGYCWDVAGVADLKLAPFHLLATQGSVHDDKTHLWHLAQLAKIAAHDEVLVATPHLAVDLQDEEAIGGAVDWWSERVQNGGEGMVVKPRDFLTWNRGRLIQPALKVRGPQYLRIIYGPEYLQHLDRLRKRGLGRKRSLAMREFVLGLEALHRFVEGDTLGAMHPCVAGILALEAEPVDPRL